MSDKKKRARIIISDCLPDGTPSPSGLAFAYGGCSKEEAGVLIRRALAALDENPKQLENDDSRFRVMDDLTNRANRAAGSLVDRAIEGGKGLLESFGEEVKRAVTAKGCTICSKEGHIAFQCPDREAYLSA